MVEDSDEESSLRDSERDEDAEYTLLFKRVCGYIYSCAEHEQEILVLFLRRILTRLESTERKIGCLQAITNTLLWGDTDTETTDTDEDEGDD
jgi:hypothetical protein